jgi:hypothetical protein
LTSTSGLSLTATGTVANSPPSSLFGTVIQKSTDGISSFMPFRVTVHKTISKLWFGNNKVTIAPGANNYVLSVYAQFDDGLLGDISATSLLSFRTDPGSIITIDADGRITATSGASGTATAYVSVPAVPAVAEININVTVQGPSTTTPQPVAPTNQNATRNLLFVAEGFTAGDSALFDQCVTQTRDRLFKDVNPPFNYLQPSFNIWKLFDPSSEQGITVGPPVTPPVSASGAPVTLSGTGTQLLQVKDSRYGFMYGGRLGQGRFVTLTFTPTANGLFTLWTDEPDPDYPYRGIIIDPRRIQLGGNRRAQFDAFFTNLTVKDSQGNPLGVSWATKGVNAGLVVFVVFDDNYGATSNGGVGIAAALGEQEDTFFTPAPATPSLDHAPLINGGTLLVDHFTNHVSHELGHARGLGDEYDSGHPALGTTYEDEDALERAESYSNLTAFYPGHKPVNAIDETLIKWNLDRMQLAAAVTAPTTGTGKSPLTVTLSAYDGNRWQDDDIAKNDPDVYIRPPARVIVASGLGNPADNRYGPYTWSPPGSSSGNTIELTLTPQDSATNFPSDVLPPGSVIYVPAVDANGDILTLIAASAATWIGTPSSGKAFPRAKDPNTGTTLTCGKEASRQNVFGKGGRKDVEEYPPNALSKLNRLWHYKIIGLYEGAGTWTCGIYRPAGMCKMRNDGFRFCVVCQYLITDTIDPGHLPEIDPNFEGGTG